MREVNLCAFDLNLLIVFDALMRERSVTRAGESVGLSQPAVSHALSRLRHLLGDELFVRTPTGMMPTPRAELLATPLAYALSEVRLALEPVVFNPSTSEQRFCVALNNYAAVLIGPALADAVLREAPAVRLELRPRGTLDLVEHLDRGDLDLALGFIDSPAERFVTAPLLEDEIVVVTRKDHPAGGRDISQAEFAALDQLEITSSLDDTGFIDRWLADQGLARHIALRAPFISTAEILVRSHLVANMSRRIAQDLARRHRLEIHKPPYRSPPVRLNMLWQRRLDRHPAHQWLRQVVRTVAEDLGAGNPVGVAQPAGRGQESAHVAPAP